MSGIKKELMIGGALALAATGLVYYLSTTPRNAPKDNEDATPDVKGDTAKSVVQPQSTKKERSFILIKPDGV